MHPLPPGELHELVDAYVQTGQAILDLGITCREADFDRPTQCPGWTVKDQLSHVASVEHGLIGHRDPEVEVPDHPWLRSEIGRRIEAGVEVRRSRSASEVVQEWQQVFAVRQAQLSEPDLDADAPAEGPLGPTTLSGLLRLRVVDLWVHEQDLRQALDRPGNLDSPGAALFTHVALTAFPGRVAKGADLPDGTTVIIESTGPVLAREGVHMTTEPDGRRLAQPLFSGEDRVDDRTGEVAPIKPADITSIKLSTDALTRRAAGRVATADLRASVHGDEDVARRVLDAIVVTP